jgi:hypothetical protein
MANWYDQYNSLQDFFNTTPASRVASATAAGQEYADPFGAATPGYQAMFDQGYTLAQDPAQFGSYKVGNFQTDPSQQVFDPKTGALFYPGESIGGSWQKNYDTGGPIGAFDLGMIIAALGSGAALAFGGAGAAGTSAAGGAETGASAVGSGELAAEAGGLSSIWGPQVATWSGVPVEGSIGAGIGTVGADTLGGMTGEGTLTGGSGGANMFNIYDLNLTGDMANALAAGGEAPLGLGDIGIGAGAADLAGGLSSAGGASTPWYETAWNLANSKTGQGIGRLGSALYQQYAAGKNRDALNDYINQTRQGVDPFGPQRPYYQGLLQQSYKDPAALYNSPEFGSLNKIFQEQITRRDATKGRRASGDYPRAIESQDYFMKWLDDYRKGLQSAAGTGIDPQSALSNLAGLYSTGNQQYYNSLGAVPNAISSIFDAYKNEKDVIRENLSSLVDNFNVY